MTEEIIGEVNVAEEIKKPVEEIPLKEKSRYYILLIGLIILVGFGYLIYYEMRHLKR